MTRINVSVTDDFLVLIDRYQELYKFPSRSAALLALAELGAGIEFGDVPAAAKQWGGDRKSKKGDSIEDA